MAKGLTDAEKLEIAVDMLHISPQHFKTIEGTQAEIEIRDKLESFKKWANTLIKEKCKEH